ncbi:hypothetical protein, partial [Dapis sp. BLCC M172]|uniref:hypothetical protein n=1 Tax=Dapis sp. BLCC M172 TaxID=2975281 RepID=UPI003CEFB16B
MELKPASSHSFSGHIPIEIDRDSWRFGCRRHDRRSLVAAISLPTNIEAEIQTSEVYSLMLRNLKTTLEEAVAETEAQIKVLGSEAIKLTLKNLTRTLIPDKKDSSTNLTSSQPNNIDEQEKNTLSQQKYQEKLIPKNPNQVQEKISTNLSSAIETETPNESIVVSINSDNTDEQEKNTLSQQKYQEKLIPKNPNQVQEKISTNLSSAIETETPNESIVVSINSDNTDEQEKNTLSQQKYQEKLIPKNPNQVQEKISTNL